MSKYVCFQGYFNCCCIKGGCVGEENCPDLCLCLESLFCNCLAISASRAYVMDKFNLASDPCDYRCVGYTVFLQYVFTKFLKADKVQ